VRANGRVLAAGRRRRRHSEEFKATVVEACRQPGVSMAAVALANGLNANLLRRWVTERGGVRIEEPAEDQAPASGVEFVPLQLLRQPVSAAARQIQIELRRGATTVSVSWPLEAAGECAAWLRGWLR
jgi:transposase